jgi:glycosyltransferase involved in cell wall biosynthesis
MGTRPPFPMDYFDITRLAKRAATGSPSGIDRVDLAYLRWLRAKGRAGYIANGVAGFTEIPAGTAAPLADEIAEQWTRGSGLPRPARLRLLRDNSLAIRAATKWRARKRGLRALTNIADPAELCTRPLLEKLDLLDSSASAGLYRCDPAWRTDSKRGRYFGISHAMLTRTPFLAALARQSRLERVFFIHDTIPCDFPQYCRAHEGQRHLLRIRNAFRYGTRLIVNSRHTAERLEAWRNRLGAPARPVAVIPIGVEDTLTGRNAVADPADGGTPPVFVTIGTIEARKNHLLLMKVWRHFAECLPPERVPRLVIIGKRGWENEEVFRLLDTCREIRPHVEEAGGVPDAELLERMRGARALLFPSHAEGWGMPLVEALALGVPVIASDIPAFREAGQGIPELLPPQDAQAWSERILHFASATPGERTRQLERVASFSPPTWEQHFAKLEDWLSRKPEEVDFPT